MSASPYLDALAKIEKGATCSFAELAALAGKPAAARAAGRVVSSTPAEDKRPWQRVVASDGRLSVDPERARVQIDRLRRDGARPRADEPVARWARRVKAAFVGQWTTRTFVAADDPRLERFDPLRVERFASAATARARGFAPMTSSARGLSSAAK